MRNLASLAIVGLVVATTAVPASAGGKDEPEPLTSEQLTSALLTIDDFPPGWAAEAPAMAVEADETGGFCNGPNLPARAQRVGSVGFAYGQFVKDPIAGPVMNEIIYSFASVKDAKRFLKLNRKTVEECPSFETVNPRSGLPALESVALVSATRLGDDSFAFRVTETDPESPESIRFVSNTSVMRSGPVVALLDFSGLSANVDESSSLTSKAVSRIGKLRAKQKAND